MQDLMDITSSSKSEIVRALEEQGIPRSLINTEGDVSLYSHPDVPLTYRHNNEYRCRILPRGMIEGLKDELDHARLSRTLDQYVTDVLNQAYQVPLTDEHRVARYIRGNDILITQHCYKGKAALVFLNAHTSGELAYACREPDSVTFMVHKATDMFSINVARPMKRLLQEFDFQDLAIVNQAHDKVMYRIGQLMDAMYNHRTII